MGNVDDKTTVFFIALIYYIAFDIPIRLKTLDLTMIYDCSLQYVKSIFKRKKCFQVGFPCSVYVCFDNSLKTLQTKQLLWKRQL